jgi:hypothetical protein
LDALTAVGYLRHIPGIRYQETEAFGTAIYWTGKASRYDATGAFVDVAARHGITSDNVKQCFGARYPAKAERVSVPVRLKPFGLDVAITPRRSDCTYASLKTDAQLANKVLGRHTWANCQPPQLFRTFRHDWTFGGRWMVAGASPIQLMPKDDRLKIQIDGQPVAEVDARASSLSIVAALAGLHEIESDPYQLGELGGFERAIVKAGVTASLGSGKLMKAWPEDMRDYERHAPMRVLSAALANAHPYLLNLPALLGVTTKQVALRLQNIEAECLTCALLALWRADVPAVPLHDGLLVPIAAATMADEALNSGYLAIAKAHIRTSIHRGGYSQLSEPQSAAQRPPSNCWQEGTGKAQCPRTDS